MQYLLLGLLALSLVLMAARGFAHANPATLTRQLRVGAGIAVLAGAAILLLRGLAGYAMSLAALGSWLIWGQGGGAAGGWMRRGQAAPGNTSRVTTAHLDVELDHDSGAMRGKVLAGRLRGRDLDTLRPVDLAELWRECRFTDPQSAQILEAFLDRSHPTWREDMDAAGDGASATTGERMSRAQALEVLGLAAAASDDDIRRAHRELMKRMHPDHGGSTYLAAKINEAKDVLLGN